ncbi:glycoside hydrolase family 15 protein [Roseomonas elaeocarpi]|uniref:Glycoside hydrolase family 15 protein n=1 Tax=Roseomonas elaeocarpi TaxID=907779 RepID=A0ABV6JWE9_9PROT
MSKPIEDYAMIGDGQTAALVARDGAVDWLCWPRFDSDACFAALLGEERHGYWRIAPEDGEGGEPAVSRRYRPDTLVLETGFRTRAGAVRVIDFMPVRPDGEASLLRLVEGLEGEVAMRCTLQLSFDYGSMPPWVSRESACHESGLVAVVGANKVVFRTEVPLDTTEHGAEGRFTVRAGQRLAFTLQHGPSHLPPPEPLDAWALLDATERHWRDWIAPFSKPTDWPEAVRRSLITLKALIHHPTGGLVAAPTLGLPEIPGGNMNWDYRYCWLRDSTFTLTALLNAGFRDEARAWHDWLLRAIGGLPEKMRIMYRLDGERRLEEWNVPWLPGYDGAQPVRVGNAAAGQRQLDIYGEVLDSTLLARGAGIDSSHHSAEVSLRLVRHVERIWREPDQGLWESRDAPQHYVYSKAMAWIAVDRFLRLDDRRSGVSAEEMARFRRLRDEIHADICEHGFNSRTGTFVQHYGSRSLDASLLLLPLTGFLPADEPRMAATITAIEEHLLEGGLVRRMAAPFGAPLIRAEEGSFIACSCWLADCMMMQGRHDDARALFERVLALRNDVGLLSEEYHVPSRRLIGNFPQALSHLALVNTALGLCGTVIRRGG